MRLDKFKPRDYQIPMMDALLNKGYKRVMAILPRRAGKDLTAFNICIRMLLRKVQTIFYVFPTYAQGRKILWDSLTIDGLRMLDFLPEELVESRNEQQMRIRLKNGSVFQIIGSDSYDTSLVGTNPGGIVFSEYALADPRSYQFARPILTANDGWALFISTPRGRNSLWDLWNIAQANPDIWFSYKMSVEDTKHIPLELIEEERRSGEMSEDLIQQEYYCFPGDQMVLGYDRLKKIEDIREGDLVVSHSGRPRKVLGTISREYEGELVRIRSYGSYEDIVCTPNHPIRVYNRESQSYEWKSAIDITCEDRLVFPKGGFGEVKVLSREIILLMAWFISDGSCFKGGVQWTIAHRKVEDICSLLKGYGIEYSIFEKEACSNVVVYSSQLVDLFKSTCGTICYDKRIPFNLISPHEKDFFHELMKGDGCLSDHRGHKKYSFSTTSKTLAYQVQYLAHSINEGYAAGISRKSANKFKFGDRICSGAEAYQVQIGFQGIRTDSSWLIRAKNCVAAKIKSISKEHYKGTVYNLKVQFDESYIVGGRAVHNCSWTMGVEGAYYSKYMDQLRLKGQIGAVLWVPAVKVHTAWDIGVRDSTSIIFFQMIGSNIHIIDSYEKNKEGLEHYAKVLQSKPYIYGKHIAPHDIEVQEWGTGMTRIEKAKTLGIDFTLSGNVSIQDGIEAVRTALPKMFFDEKSCASLIKAIENYRQEWDEKRKVYKAIPLHDRFSHFSDAMRYLCVSLPKTRDGLSPEDLDKKYREARYGPESNLPPALRGGHQYNGVRPF